MERSRGLNLLLAAVTPLLMAAPAAAFEVDEGPVNLGHDCDGGSLSVHHEEDAGGAALRILSIYEADTQFDDAIVDVLVEVDGETVLVLSAYDPVHWRVAEDHEGALQRIIVAGDEETQITAPPGVPVEFADRASSSDDWWAPGTRTLVDRAQALSGLHLRSFHGCYRGASFTFTDGTGPLVDTGEPDCESEEEGIDHEPDAGAVVANCGALTVESHFCLGRTDVGIVAVGLDSGDVCPVVALPPDDNGGLPSSMAWHGTDVYFCEGQWGNLTRASLEDGTVQRSFAYCDAVASFDGDLLMLPSGSDPANFHQLWTAGNLTQAHCGDHSVIPMNMMGSRLTADGGRIYASHHSASSVEIFEPPQEGPVGGIQLEGFDTWIHGMSVLNGQSLAINATATEGRVAVFDMHGGELLREVEVAQEFRGLVCMPGLDPSGDDDDDDGGDDDDDDEIGDPDTTLITDDCACSASGRTPGAAVAAALVLAAGIAIRRRR